MADRFTPVDTMVADAIRLHPAVTALIANPALIQVWDANSVFEVEEAKEAGMRCWVTPMGIDPVLEGSSVTLAGWEARIYLAR